MMDNDVVKFILKILAAVIFMIVLAWFVFTWLLPGEYLPVLPWMLAAFTVISVFTHIRQLTLSKKDMGRFTRNSMIISLLRLVLYSVFAIVYLANNKQNALVFVGSIVFVYSVFTVIEVSDLARVVRKK